MPRAPAASHASAAAGDLPVPDRPGSADATDPTDALMAAVASRLARRPGVRVGGGRGRDAPAGAPLVQGPWRGTGYTDVAGYWRAGQSQQDAAHFLHRLHHMSDLAVPDTLRAAVSLDLAEHIADGHIALDASAGADRGTVLMLQLIAHEGLFALTSDPATAEERIGLTSFGSALLEDAAHSKLDRRNGYSRLNDAWPGLLHTARTGQSGLEQVRGHFFWDELATEECLGRTFDEALATGAAYWAGRTVKALELDGVGHQFPVLPFRVHDLTDQAVRPERGVLPHLPSVLHGGPLSLGGIPASTGPVAALPSPTTGRRTSGRRRAAGWSAPGSTSARPPPSARPWWVGR